jgi:hypothetical protein
MTNSIEVKDEAKPWLEEISRVLTANTWWSNKTILEILNNIWIDGYTECQKESSKSND